MHLTRLDEYAGAGPIVWAAGFNNTDPHAQLYVTIDDLTGELVKIKAYGEQEQTIWLGELMEAHRLNIGESVDFF